MAVRRGVYFFLINKTDIKFRIVFKIIVLGLKLIIICTLKTTLTIQINII